MTHILEPMRNLELAFRTLFRTPFVTAVAILSLALGIGANAAIFSVFNQILLRPLPVPQPERLVNFAAPGPIDGSNSCGLPGSCEEVFSYRMFRDLEKASTGFSGIAGHVLIGANVSLPGQTPLSGEAALVSGSYFPTLGIKPAVGRLFTADDDRTIGGHFVTVLSYDYWETQLGADPSVVGKQLVVNGRSTTVIGVVPKGFTGTTLGARPYVFVPLTMRSAYIPGWRGYEDRNSYWVYVFGRLEPGVTLEQGRASVNAVYTNLINEVEAPRQQGMSEQTLARFRQKQVTMTDGRRGQSSMFRQTQTPLILLFSITGTVLLIACANIANLLLARGANRAMEMAVRLSLGATRRQLVTQLLTESVLLAVLGGIASVVVAYGTLGGIARLLPAQMLTAIPITMSLPALGFTALLSLTTGLFFGIAPALQSTRPDLVTELRNNSGKLSGGRGAARFRTALVTAQIALSMALLVSAALFTKSLRNVSRVDLGLRIDNIVTFRIFPARNGYDSTRAFALYDRVTEALAATPGVTSVTTSGIALLSGNNWGQGVSVEGFVKDLDTDDGSRFTPAGPGYFTTLGIPLLAGRDFTPSDNVSPQQVAIVNEAFAKKFGLGRNAVGKRMSVNNDSLNITIVGLAKDAKYSEVKGEIPPLFVRPYRQASVWSNNTFYVKTSLPPEQILRAIPPLMKTIDPNLPVDRLRLMTQQVSENVFMDRLITTLSAAFAVLATLLAAVGLYGVLAYSVTQRTREIGVRMALGASAAAVRRMVLKQVGWMTLVGGLIGIAGAIAIGRGAQSLLFELQGFDPMMTIAAAVALSLVALGAGLAPATRASRIDPIAALRQE